MKTLVKINNKLKSPTTIMSNALAKYLLEFFLIYSRLFYDC